MSEANFIDRLRGLFTASAAVQLDGDYSGDAAAMEAEVHDALAAAALGAADMGVDPGPHGFLELLAHRLNVPERSLKEWEAAFDEVPTLRSVLGRKSDRVARRRWSLHRPARNLKAHRRRGLVAEVRAIEEPEHRFSALDDLTHTGELVEITEHPLLTLINKGNSYLTGFWVRWCISTYLDLTGEVPVLLDIRRVHGHDIPVQAFPVPPSWCAEKPTPQRPFYVFYFNGYRMELPPDHVMWMRIPSPANPYGRSRGLAMTLADEIDADESAAKFIASHFYQRGRPDVLIVGPGLTKTGPDGRAGNTDELERKWARQGRKGPGTPLFLNVGGEIKPSVHNLGHNMEQMQMPSLRRMGRDQVRQTFGMPPELMGVLDNGSNRSTVDAAGAIFDEWAILPRLVQLQEEFDARLLPRYPGGAALGILTFGNPVSADKEFQLKAMRAQPTAPTQAEWRNLQRLPKRRGTDVHMVKGVPAPRLDQHQPPSQGQAGTPKQHTTTEAA